MLFSRLGSLSLITHSRRAWFLSFVAYLLLNSCCFAIEWRDVVARLDRDFRALISKEDRLVDQLSRLPGQRRWLTNQQFGYHSGFIPEKTEEVWVQIDLGRNVKADTLVLVPVVRIEDGKAIDIGFPKRFRIEISSGPDSKNAEILVEYSDIDCPNPGPGVYSIPMSGTEGRFVRLTATDLWTDDVANGNRTFLAFEEMMVLRGNRNLALGVSVEASSSNDLSNEWKPQYLTDNITSLGLPIGAAQQRPYHKGFHSRFSKEEAGSIEHWVQVDLGNEYSVDEIRLIGAQPFSIPGEQAHEFPSSWRIELSNHVGFRTSILVAGEENVPRHDFRIIDARGHRARYLRLTAEAMSKRVGRGRSFALAEMQVYSGDENVALGKAVKSPRSMERHNWSKEYLVDGKSSQHHLLELPEWIRRMKVRQILEGVLEQTRIQTKLIVKKYTSIGVAMLGVVIVVLVLFVGGVYLLQHRRRRMEIERIRHQIAFDLHDDIGSNLNSISLYAELMLRDSQSSQIVVDDLERIKRLSLDSMSSMRDIVWMLDSRNHDWEELLVHMRMVANDSLANTEIIFELPEQFPAGSIPMAWMRDFFFIFKEAMHNISEHAHASLVRVSILIDIYGVKLIIKDDGSRAVTGQKERKGKGLNSMKDRANKHGGDCYIGFVPGGGTQVDVTFKAY